MTDWIEWDGGECPVPPDTLVDIRIRDGYEAIGEDVAKGWNWKHHMLRNDIVAYRIHHPNEGAELFLLRALTQQQAEQIAELKRDAERLDYLDTLTKRKHNVGKKEWPISSDMHFGALGVSLYVRTGVGSQIETSGIGMTVRAAIDRALAKPKAMKGEE